MFKRLAKFLIRLRVCAGGSEPLLVAYTTLLEISCCGSNIHVASVAVNPEIDHLHQFFKSIGLHVQANHFIILWSVSGFTASYLRCILGNPGVTHSVPTTEWVTPGLPRMFTLLLFYKSIKVDSISYNSCVHSFAREPFHQCTTHVHISSAA